MSKKRCRRPQMQRTPRVSPGSQDETQRMLGIMESIADTGCYPCPECGTMVSYQGMVQEYFHFACPNPDCRYEAFWDWGFAL